MYNNMLVAMYMCTCNIKCMFYTLQGRVLVRAIKDGKEAVSSLLVSGVHPNLNRVSIILVAGCVKDSLPMQQLLLLVQSCIPYT